jgi:hypothetical protein
LLTGEPGDASLAVAVQPDRGKGSDWALNDSGAVATMSFMWLAGCECAESGAGSPGNAIIVLPRTVTAVFVRG